VWARGRGCVCVGGRARARVCVCVCARARVCVCVCVCVWRGYVPAIGRALDCAAHSYSTIVKNENVIARFGAVAHQELTVIRSLDHRFRELSRHLPYVPPPHDIFWLDVVPARGMHASEENTQCEATWC
jgi:hypothetical protein